MTDPINNTLPKVLVKLLTVILMLPFNTLFIAIGILAGLAWGNIISGWDKAGAIIKWGWYDKTR